MTIRTLLDSLKKKKGFLPDILVVDQLTTMKSLLSNANSYDRGKEIVEGVKSICQEYKLIGFSGAQANRGSLKNEEGVQMDNVSESWGIPQIADVVFGMTKTKTNEQNNIYDLRCNGIKNRIGGILDTVNISANPNYMRIL